MRDSFVFYKSFYDALKLLEPHDRAAAYDAVMSYALEGIEPEVSGVVAAVFLLIRPQIDANNTRYENGKRGGRPRKEEPNKNQKKTEQKPKQNQNKTKAEPNVNVNVNVNENVNDIKDYCAEPTQERRPTPPPVITIPLNDGTEYPVMQDDVDEYQKLYPAVNVMQELRTMRGWCLDNPTRKKTRSGVRRFIGGWLAKEQNKGKNREPPDKNRFNRFKQQEYDFDDIKQRLVSNG